MGVRRVFGYPGDGINGLLGGLSRFGTDKIQFVQARANIQQAATAPQIRHLIHRAVRVALREKRVTALVIPNDRQDQPYQDPPRQHGTLHSGVRFNPPLVVDYHADLRRAAHVLNSGRKVTILVG